MSSKRDSKRIKQKQQQNYLSPVPKKQINQLELNPLNLRDLSPFRPNYGSHNTTNHIHLSNTELTIIDTPANTVPRGLYLEQIEQGLHSISAVLNWQHANEDSQENQEEDSQILEMSEDDSSKSAKKETQQNPEKQQQKDIQHLRTAQPKQKKETQKKLSQTNIPISSSKKVFCNCKKTKCLKLYCDCFRINQTCDGCNCVGCHNLPVYQQERNNSMLTLMDRNPQAFKPKIDQQQHAKGCHCRKSYCQKKYCECYQAGLKCGSNCKCEQCKNRSDDEPDRKDGNNSSMNSLIVNIQGLMNEQNMKEQPDKFQKGLSLKKPRTMEQKIHA